LGYRKLTRLTLGSYPATGIAAARTKAIEAKRALAEGRPKSRFPFTSKNNYKLP